MAILPVTVVIPPTTSPLIIKKKNKKKNHTKKKKKNLLFHHNAIFTAATAITTATFSLPLPHVAVSLFGAGGAFTLVIRSGWQWLLLMLPPLPTGLLLLLLSYDHLIISHLNWIIMLSLVSLSLSLQISTSLINLTSELDGNCC